MLFRHVVAGVKLLGADCYDGRGKRTGRDNDSDNKKKRTRRRCQVAVGSRGVSKWLAVNVKTHGDD